MVRLIRTFSRLLNAVRLLDRPSHRRRVRAARKVLSKLRSWDGPEVGARLFGYLRLLDPLTFEELVLSALEDGGRIVLRNRRYTGDGGVDGNVRLPGLGWCPLQVKRYGAHIDHHAVQDLARLVEKRRRAAGLFVHTGRTGAGAYRQLAGSRVILVSGKGLVRLILHGELPRMPADGAWNGR